MLLWFDSITGRSGEEESHCLDGRQTNAQESKNDGDEFCRYTSIYILYSGKYSGKLAVIFITFIEIKFSLIQQTVNNSFI